MNDRLDAAPPVLVGCADRTDQAFTRTGQLSLLIVSCGGAGVSLATVAACAASMTSTPQTSHEGGGSWSCSALVVRSGHLGHTQVCERQLEVARVEHLCSYFLAARASEPVQLVFVPLPRFNAVEGRRRHGTTGRSVEQQAGTAKSVELLECGQDSRLVEIDASVDLIRADLDPGCSHTGTVIRPVVTVQDSDLPFLDVCAATENLRGTVTNRPNRLRARAHRLLGLPGAGSNTSAGRPVDQQGQAGVPVAALERGHHGVADVGNAGVDGRGLCLESGSACVHDLP